MKTKNELNTIKKEFDSVNAKLKELTEDEPEQVCGGGIMTEILNKVKKEGGEALHGAAQVTVNTAQEKLLDTLKN